MYVFDVYHTVLLLHRSYFITDDELHFVLCDIGNDIESKLITISADENYYKL